FSAQPRERHLCRNATIHDGDGRGEAAPLGTPRCRRTIIIRARSSANREGNIPEKARRLALETAKKRFDDEMSTKQAAENIADEVLQMLTGGMRADPEFHFACEELLRQGSVLAWGALEVLAKDLFAVWVNASPARVSWLMKDERTKRRFPLR